MASQGRNKARNQIRGSVDARWLTGKKRRNRKLAKLQKKSRRANRSK